MAPSDSGITLAAAEVHYDHAPIVEAIIDIQVRFGVAPSQDALRNLSAQWKGRFPTSADLNLSQVTVGFGAAVPPQVQSSSTPLGFRLATSTTDRVLQVQTRGLTFSHFAPYTDWKSFSGEFLKLWGTYCDELNPVAVTRIAVRYINQIVIPEPRFEASDYFQLYPEIPKQLPQQDVTGLFMQLQMPQLDISPTAMANINFGSGTRTPDGRPAFLLDFDVYVTIDVAPRAEAVTNLLMTLRGRKNDLFEGCITDKTRELIK